MADSRFQPRRFRREEKLLEDRLRAMEFYLQQLPLRVRSDPFGGPPVPTGTGGGFTPEPGGGGGGEGGVHGLLDDAAHRATITAEPTAGDLVIASSGALWTRLAIGSADQVLKVSSGLPAWASISTVATAAAPVQAWRRNQIQNAGTSKGQMKGLEDLETGITMLRSGTIVGVSVDLESDLSNSASDWYEVEAYKRTPSDPLPSYSATGVTARITGASGDNDVSARGTGSVTFAAGDQLTMYDQRQNLGASAVSSKATLWIVLDP